MSVISYLDKAINELKLEDEKVRFKFYSEENLNDLDKLHTEHHTIKRWINQLQSIKTEFSETIRTEQTILDVKPLDSDIFIISRGDMIGKAYGKPDGDQFKVLAGSFISPNVVSYMYDIVKKLRIDNATNIDENNLLITDLLFDNPGQAARFVTGKQVNGIEEWKTADGTSYKDFSENTYIAEEEADKEDYSNTKPKSVTLFGETINVSHWREVLIAVCEKVYISNPNSILNLPKTKR